MIPSYLCPYCGRKVKIIKFGSGWIGICCSRIVYNESVFPWNNECERTDALGSHSVNPEEEGVLKIKYIRKIA
jgi:hypothetical protein